MLARQQIFQQPGYAPISPLSQSFRPQTQLGFVAVWNRPSAFEGILCLKAWRSGPGFPSGENSSSVPPLCKGRTRWKIFQSQFWALLQRFSVYSCILDNAFTCTGCGSFGTISKIASHPCSLPVARLGHLHIVWVNIYLKFTTSVATSWAEKSSPASPFRGTTACFMHSLPI